MADDPKTNSTTTTSSTGAVATTGEGGVIADKNKSAEQYIKEAEAKYIVPPLVRQKFPDLIKLIYETESMNEEEREYWLQIMPIMSEEQTTKFRDILVNEKNQLAKLDKEYEMEMAKTNKGPAMQLDEVKMKGKIQEIKQAEATSEKEEQSKEDEVLKQLNNL
ncbi:hypothetical protein A3I58_03705 [Candidatus Peregrinibacteria bacterium RIFCSPLOWO2_02_FULL_39_10]|nr:MAG: hypothetical protein A3I58_03705 [Candidatus Peregrinibacteria bacterium RIFCSPLOWO2_02_FULL_39_10]